MPGILILTVAMSMAASATVITKQAEARTEQAAPARTAAPRPVTRRSFTSIVESNILDRPAQPSPWVSRVKESPTRKKRVERKQPNSWTARVKKPSARENRAEREQLTAQKKRNEANHETIIAEIKASTILNPDTQDLAADFWITEPQGTEIAEDWTLVVPSNPFGNTDTEWHDSVSAPWSDFPAFQSLAKSSQWLLFTTSNYFHEGQVGIERILTGRTLEPLGSGQSSATSRVSKKNTPRPRGNGSRIPAYIALFVIFAIIVGLAISGKGMKRSF